MLNSSITTHDAHRRIRTHLAAVGITEPAGVTRACDLDDALHTTATTDPTVALKAGIAGSITPAAASKQLLAAATTLVAQERALQIRNDVQPDLDRSARASLLADAERIVAHLRPVLDGAVAAIGETLSMLGTLTPPTEITQAPGLCDLVQRSSDAQAQLRHVIAVRQDLADVGYATPEDISWWVTSHVDLDCGHHRLRDLIVAGVPVTVNNVVDIEKLTRARTDEAERIAVARAEKKKRDADRDPLVRSLRKYRESLRTPEPQDAA